MLLLKDGCEVFSVFIFSVDSLVRCRSSVASLSLFIDGSTFTYKLSLPTLTFIHDRHPGLPAHKFDLASLIRTSGHLVARAEELKRQVRT